MRILLFMVMCLSGINAVADDVADERREAGTSPNMRVHVLRLRPGQDLFSSLQDYAKRHEIRAGIVLTTVGSLEEARLRLADRSVETAYKGKMEIVSLVGTIDAGSAHLHLSVSDGRGRTVGGHLVKGCRVYTTAEVAIGELADLRFSRETDPESGYAELKIDPVK